MAYNDSKKFPKHKTSRGGRGVGGGMAKLKRKKRSRGTGNFLTSILLYGVGMILIMYVIAMVVLTRYTAKLTQERDNAIINNNNNNNAIKNINKSNENTNTLRSNNQNDQQKQNEKNPVNSDQTQSTEQQQQQQEQQKKEPPQNRRTHIGRKWGQGVQPDILIAGVHHDDHDEMDLSNAQSNKRPTRILTAYANPMTDDERDAWWQTKPLPILNTTSNDLMKFEYPRVNSCRRLPQLWPVDDSPVDSDPYLPWIHDVFPTHDGKFIQFVAENKERCHTGTTTEEVAIIRHTLPQLALLQHVPIKRIPSNDTSDKNSPRYKLTTHEDADPDGLTTRFICKFQPSGVETLSIFNIDYEYGAYRKNADESRPMIHGDRGDSFSMHTAQVTFQCPVPKDLINTVRTGSSVVEDLATLFVDLIPIRTPPRRGPANEFLQPHYAEFRNKNTPFDPLAEWGNNHILPKIENAARWANIPICKPSLLTYGKYAISKPAEEIVTPANLPPDVIDNANKPLTIPIMATGKKQHRLVSCLWASTGYTTRGNRFAINDGQRRLLEWITYNILIGVEHFYLYDNSAAYADGSEDAINLHPIAELFPDHVTVIDWPARICNNNPNNVDSRGDRSSQYAAEASCRLRFGPHTEWIAQFDVDEYLIPMGSHNTVSPILDKIEKEGLKIVSFGSLRAWPRKRYIEEPVKEYGARICGQNKNCFQLRVPMNHTMLQTYNCDQQKPGEKVKQMPAEKQIYRPDYVKHHFIHYSTITEYSELNRAETKSQTSRSYSKRATPDPYSRFAGEVDEGLMLHTKAVATQDTVGWEEACKPSAPDSMTCRIGSPFPEGHNDMTTAIDISKGDNGWKYNCYLNHKIEDYYVPLLEEHLEQHVPEIAARRQRDQEQT